MNNSLIFRGLKSDDINRILEICNFHIENGLSNFEEKPLLLNEFRDMCENILKSNLPFIICEKDKYIIGFTYLNKFRNKSGYRFSFENSIYIDEKFTGIGVGAKLLKKLIEESKKNKDIKNIVAVIGGDNPIASIKIHKKNGFNMVGSLKKIGFKKNKWVDAIYMQKVLNEKN